MGFGGTEQRCVVSSAQSHELTIPDDMQSSTKVRKWAQLACAGLLVALVVFIATRERKRPALPKWQFEEKLMETAVADKEAHERAQADAALIRGLLEEDLSNREFDFTVVVAAVSGRKVRKAGELASSQRVVGAIRSETVRLLEEMNAADSPVRGLRRINEGSRFFEDGLRERLDAVEGLSCDVPLTREGVAQRSGYPDLRIVDEATGDVFYLDPKLMERGSVESSLRTFYFEPKGETLKIGDDAVHLLLGIEHDGNDGAWRFTGYRLVDLSGLRVRLKAEFQASNREIYRGSSVLDKSETAGKDGSE